MQQMRWFAALLLLWLPTTAGALDEARALVGIDQARATHGVTGHRVVIGIIDRGLDHTHPGLRNEDGSTRILAMLDLTNDEGAAADGNRYGVGTIVRKAQIDEALRAGTKLGTEDAEGRGTANAGLACGNGLGSKDKRYRGVAPEAQIVFVKLKLDADPWQRTRLREERPVEDGEAKKDVWFDLRRLRMGMAFCVDEARSAERPLVMLLNFGQLGGPTDGSSKLCRTIDELTGPETRGVALVTGSSDKGDRQNRANGRVTAGGSVTLEIEKEAEGEVSVDIWYAGTDRFDVSLRTPQGAAGPFAAPKTGKSEYGDGYQLYHLASSRNQILTLGGKRQIRVDLIGAPGKYAVSLHGAQITDGRFDAFIGPNPENPMEEPFNQFTNHLAAGSLWDGASATHAIVVGCSVLRDEWKNIQGRGLGQMGEGKPGELWRGSGTGPTIDGRAGVTLCVPADRITTAYAPGSDWAEVRKHVMADDGGLYGLAGGTSAAAAVVAGVVALMFEADPTLSGAEAKRILQATARRTEASGDLPNARWGHGILDAAAALDRVAQRTAGAKKPGSPKKRKAK
ncbi:MAG: S8 family serine peptidase [Planctomycetota bacterium]|nr:S8 family serine peptidase [Planctomycetota bacterium]